MTEVIVKHDLFIQCSMINYLIQDHKIYVKSITK